MTSEATLKYNISEALAKISEDSFPEAAQELLDVLGYQSERVPPEHSGTVKDFIAEYPSINTRPNAEPTESEKSFSKHAHSVRVLFQITDSELEETMLYDKQVGFEPGSMRSFLFVAVELRNKENGSYPRTEYAKFAQEINKRFRAPAVVLFKTPDDLLTLAFVHRRLHKRDSSRDVLGSVSLVREIETVKSHRAHLSILADLSLENRLQWIRKKDASRNFDGLLASWLDALDTEVLTGKFYKELFAWFKRAVDEARLPETEVKAEEQVIRFITRILFVWFIKEKGLVAEELFSEKEIDKYLKDYDPEQGDSYYRVVLQNLFFATLNTEIDKRGFSSVDQKTHRDPSRYRYQDEIDDVDGLRRLFDQSPFINGGLFECLDSFESVGAGGLRIDYFTDNMNNPEMREYKKLAFPNRLFFDDNGLFELFERYKFTIEENTPIEREVALDPELMGKAFENLLAAHNPETRETVRKQTGSYYTPTPVVEYMVDEVLLESLATKAQPIDGDGDWWRERLRYLLDYACDDAEDLFEMPECDNLVRVVSEIKVIDPAVGSGAFPMGVLHKLTLVLRRLDPDNVRWKEIQKTIALNKADKAFDKDDPDEREKQLAEINTIFQLYKTSDFGRKLYLIQNSIFGVDVQAIACQIAKLRFFISLAIEQEPTSNRENNYGIKPLPNLETRFIAADTLIGLERPSQREFQTPAIFRLEQEVANNRERFFHASTRYQKQEYSAKDKDLRRELADALRENGFSADVSEEIASWDPYDQNASANWFDPEYMFDVKDGFDIVIGNPPYVKVENFNRGTRNILEQEYRWVGDLYEHFIVKGMDLCASAGLFSYIANDSFVTFSSKQRIRELLLENQILHLVKSPSQTFEASIYTAIFVLKKEGITHSHEYMTGEFIFDSGLKYKALGKVSYKDVRSLPGNRLLLTANNNLLMRLLLIGQKFNNYYNVLDTGIDSGNVREKIFFNTYSEGLERLLQGKQIQRYLLYWNSPRAKYKYCDINYSPLPIPGVGRGGRPSSRDEYWNFRGGIKNHHQPERLLMRQTDDDLVVAYHNQERHGRFYTDNTLFTILPKRDEKDLKFLMALLNSRLMNYIYHSLSQEQGKSQAQVKVKTVRELPIVLPGQEDRSYIDYLVERILLEKTKNPLADTSTLEEQVDAIIYQLYRLTEDEISVVEEG